MFNTPVILKLRLAVDRGDVVRVRELLQKYNYLVHTQSDLAEVSLPVTQIEFYELQLAEFLSRRYEVLHFVRKLRVAGSEHPHRVIGFVGRESIRAVLKYQEMQMELEEWYKRRYYSHKIKKGAAAAEAYRSGFLEAVLDRSRVPDRSADFYRSVFNEVKLRDILPKSRPVRDQAARSVGLDDGLVCSLATLRTLKSLHAQGLRSYEEFGEPCTVA